MFLLNFNLTKIMSSKRSYLSGADKRRLKKQREERTKRLAFSMDKFTVSVDKKVNSDNVLLSDDCDNICDGLENESNNNEKSSFKGKDCVELPIQDIEERECGNDSVSHFNSDPAMWTIIKDQMIEYFLVNPPSQNIHLVKETENLFGKIKRSLTINNFYHEKVNGEKLNRRWLVLSESTKNLYCWVCKLLQANASSSFKSQLISGLSDWKHVTSRLKEHENSVSHRQSMMTLSQRSTFLKRIDSSLVQQYEDETKYWISVLERVVSVVKFLSIRGLPFFGDDETIGSRHNGNFLGCLELIAQFDPFLSAHLAKYKNPGKGNVNYLSSTCINEFIGIMAQKVEKQIIDEILSAKYFSVIVDSTPDITHLDQLCFVIRYINDSQPIERFLKFIPIYSHKSE